MDLGDCLTNACREYNNICLTGAFNVPALHWDVTTGTPDPKTPIGEIFVDAEMNAHSLRQLNFNTTRGV